MKSSFDRNIFIEGIFLNELVSNVPIITQKAPITRNQIYLLNALVFLRLIIASIAINVTKTALIPQRITKISIIFSFLCAVAIISAVAFNLPLPLFPSS
ncbi:MAG: hypothetical protein PHF98_00765 [Patescibacteria group bacterium]|nr:hypothetical protein [Patescibacteria group bacterium]